MREAARTRPGEKYGVTILERIGKVKNIMPLKIMVK
jgi:hypothetical protein